MIITQGYKTVASVRRSRGSAWSFQIDESDKRDCDWQRQTPRLVRFMASDSGPTASGDKERKKKAKGPLCRDPLLVSRSLPQHARPGCSFSCGVCSDRVESPVGGEQMHKLGNKGRLAMTRFRQF